MRSSRFASLAAAFLARYSSCLAAYDGLITLRFDRGVDVTELMLGDTGLFGEEMGDIAAVQGIQLSRGALSNCDVEINPAKPRHGSL